MNNGEREFPSIGAVARLVAVPALALAASFGIHADSSRAAEAPSQKATSTQVSLDIRNCITTVLPLPLDENNPYCADLLKTIDAQSKTGKIKDCNNVSTTLEAQPTDTQTEKFRDCASATFLALEQK